MASKGTRNKTSDRPDHKKLKGEVSFIEKLGDQFLEFRDELKSLRGVITQQSDVINHQTKTIENLEKMIVSKDAEIAELRARLHKNSGNSSKPPSSDFFNKPKPSGINQRGKAGAKNTGKGTGNKGKKKPGGQKGHTGSTMKLKGTPDVVHQCLPEECIGCEFASVCESRVAESRNVMDVRIIQEQSRYDRIERKCQKRSVTITGSFPEGVSAPQQYGSTLKAIIVTLSSFGMVSGMRISEIVAGLTGIQVSDATVYNIIGNCAQRGEEFISQLKEQVINADVTHFDETGIRINGKIHWAHTASTARVTVIHAHRKRGSEGTLAGGVLQNFSGVAVHDCWGSYYKEVFKDATHAVCGAHIDRELEGVYENTKQKWARALQKLLGKMFDTKREFLDRGIGYAPPDMIAEFKNEYDKILEKGFGLNPYKKPKKAQRGRPKKGKVLSLLERLKLLKDDVLRFFTDFRVPFSNNVGEKSFRLSKLKMKVAGSFRSVKGGSNFCIIFSIIDTVRKNEGNPFRALVDLFDNKLSLDFLN